MTSLPFLATSFCIRKGPIGVSPLPLIRKRAMRNIQRFNHPYEDLWSISRVQGMKRTMISLTQ